MLIFAIGIAYAGVCWICAGRGWWRPLLLPHNFCANNKELAGVAILGVFFATILAAVVCGVLEHGGRVAGQVNLGTIAGTLVGAGGLGLILDAARRLKENSCDEKAGVRETSGEEEDVAAPAFLLIMAEEAELVKLDADFRLNGRIEKTPFRKTRVTLFEVAPIIQEVAPNATIIPWTEELNETIMNKHEEAVELSKDKIAEALAAESSRDAAIIEAEGLSRKLDEVVAANRKYEKVLQEMRARPGGVAAGSGTKQPGGAGAATISETIKHMQDYTSGRR